MEGGPHRCRPSCQGASPVAAAHEAIRLAVGLNQAASLDPVEPGDARAQRLTEQGRDVGDVEARPGDGGGHQQQPVAVGRFQRVEHGRRGRGRGRAFVLPQRAELDHVLAGQRQ